MADHHPGAPFGVNQVAVFADPAQAGFLSPGLVQQRCGVNTGAPTAVGPLFRKPATDSSQPLIHNPVIVPPPAVAGDSEGAGGGFSVDVIVEANGEKAVGSVQQQPGVSPTGGGHPGHVSLMTMVQPALQSFGAQLQPRTSRDSGNANGIEPFLSGAALQSLA